MMIGTCVAQTDFHQLNVKADVNQGNFPSRKVKFMNHDHPSVWVKYNPFNLAAGTLMIFYQGLISPQFSADCLYHPSCSAFGVEAIKHHGLFKGVFLTGDRLSRCNRMAVADLPISRYDPNTGKVVEDVKKFKRYKSQHHKH
jgi:putative membrane protein insertion efficiency factor